MPCVGIALAEAFEIDRLAVLLHQHDGAGNPARGDLAVDEILDRPQAFPPTVPLPARGPNAGGCRARQRACKRRWPRSSAANSAAILRVMRMRAETSWLARSIVGQRRYCIAAAPIQIARPDGQSTSGIGIDQLLLFGAVLREQIDEGPDLRREMMAVRIDRIHREFDRPVFRQQANQPAGFEIVMRPGSPPPGKCRRPAAPPCRSVSPLLVTRLPDTRTEAGVPLRSAKCHSSPKG